MALPTSILHADIEIPKYFESEFRKKTSKFIVEEENESYLIKDSLRLRLRTATVGGRIVDSCTWEHSGLWQVDLIVPKDSDLDVYNSNIELITCIMEDDTNLPDIKTHPTAKVERAGEFGKKGYLINVSIEYSFLRAKRNKTGNGC